MLSKVSYSRCPISFLGLCGDRTSIPPLSRIDIPLLEKRNARAFSFCDPILQAITSSEQLDGHESVTACNDGRLMLGTHPLSTKTRRSLDLKAEQRVAFLQLFTSHD